MAVLYRHDIGQAALGDLKLLADVIKAKERFFYTATAKYDLCLKGQANLLPGDVGLGLLRGDYAAMIDAQMLEAPLEFDEIVERLRALQNEANERTGSVA